MSNDDECNCEQALALKEDVRFLTGEVARLSKKTEKAEARVRELESDLQFVINGGEEEDLPSVCTPAQRAVLAAMRDVPHGELYWYREREHEPLSGPCSAELDRREKEGA